jgi:hypothetical protein
MVTPVITKQTFNVTIEADFTLPESTVEIILLDWARKNTEMGMPVRFHSIKIEETNQGET